MGGGCPFLAAQEQGGYRHFPEQVKGEDFPAKFIAAIALHRHWARHDKDLISG